MLRVRILANNSTPTQKPDVQSNSCTWIFTVDLFTVPKRLNKLNIHQQINAKPTTLYIYNRISPFKSNDPMPTMYKARGVLLWTLWPSKRNKDGNIIHEL